MPVAPLPITDLRPRGLPAELDFETTEALEELEGPFGHARAAAALAFGLDLAHGGYNVYAMGPAGVDRHALVGRMLRRAAADAATPSDWCYLNDFADPQHPLAVQLPAGRGQALRRELERLAEELRAAIPAAFEGRDHLTRLQFLEEEATEARERAIEEVQREAAARDITLLTTPVGFTFVPTRDGQPVEPDQFATFPEEVRQRYRQDLQVLQAHLLEALRAMPDLQRRARDRVKALNREVALATVGHLLEELRRRYADLPRILAHLDAVQEDVVEHVHELLGAGEPRSAAQAGLHARVEARLLQLAEAARAWAGERGRTAEPGSPEDRAGSRHVRR